MIFFPFELVKIYVQERIDEAEHYRQIQQIRANQSSLSDYLFSKINQVLVWADWRLKKQFKQIMLVLT
jgi:hypothetical protein